MPDVELDCQNPSGRRHDRDTPAESPRPSVEYPPTAVGVSTSWLPHSDYRFCELFAGEANLTAAVEAAGVPVRAPDDAATGGANFVHRADVDAVRTELLSLMSSGVKLMVHFAPPCSTFSRARDRSSATRLRSREFPQGLARLASKTHEANLIARHCLDLAEDLARAGPPSPSKTPRAPTSGLT